MGQIPITGGFYKHPSLPVSNQQCVNLFESVVEGGGLASRVLLGTPGIVEITSTGDVLQGNRGAWKKNEIYYVVNGDTLYSIDRTIDGFGTETFSYTSLGTIAGTGRVSMCDNGTQLMVLVPGLAGYIYNEDAGTPFQQITDAGFTANGTPQYSVFIDGYFACTTDSKKWIVSALNDGLSWNALDFSTAESNPDAIVAPVVVRNQIFITGSETMEGYQNIGGADFPFQRNNIFIDKGCSAPFSLINAANTFFMIGAGKNETPAIWQFIDNNMAKISTNAIDNILANYSDTNLQTAFGWTYGQKGAYFIGFTLPDTSFVFELTSKTWSERKSILAGTENRWRANSVTSAYGRILVTDKISGKIGYLDLEIYKEFGNDISSYFSIRPFSAGGREIVIPSLELTMESGVGNSDSPDPIVSMSLSRDGKTYNYERSRHIGTSGQKNRRIVWRRNGHVTRFGSLLFRVSDPVKKVFIKLEAE